MNYLNHAARKILIFAAGLALIRYLRGAEGKPLLDILAVAILEGTIFQRFRLAEVDATDRSVRRLANILVGAGIACWAGVFWLEHDTPERGAWILIVGIVGTFTVSLIEWLKVRATKPPVSAIDGANRPDARSLLPRSALYIIALFVVFELVVVSWLGSIAMHRFGLSEAMLTPVSLLVYGGAGFMARRRGGSGALAGAMVTTADTVTWVIFGGTSSPDVAPVGTGAIVIGVVILTGLVGGAILGAIGGWIGGRVGRKRLNPHTPSNPGN